MFCRNRITLIGFLGKDAETHVLLAQRHGAHSVFRLADQRQPGRTRDSGEYKDANRSGIALWLWGSSANGPAH